ncbi:hypothetical protein KOI35_13580 [Actinoplanes bogorensis]|uniref:Uncharacterized protein n=1 Tax=Paractinoplanes bogorensis TaxID=1610840 RepID=A0ABS5YM54_9ACTN|nr:hypothetical protein [Actinoplanes bogorensis]MBU2664528.1 hypothetical protein [Actinoplanes bogorensis]
MEVLMGRVTSAVRATAVSAAVAATAIFGGSTPAQAAYPTDSVLVSYGSSNFTGTATFYNQSVGVSGTLKVAAGACMRVKAYAKIAGTSTEFPEVSSSLKCGGSTTYKNYPVSLTATAPVRGGADLTYVSLFDVNDHFLTLDGAWKP